MNFGLRLKKIREGMGLSETELGKMIGLNEKEAYCRIHKYETGQQKPKEDMVEKLADVLKVTPEALSRNKFVTSKDVMMLLYELEEIYGFQIVKEGESYLLQASPDLVPDEIYQDMKIWYKMTLIHKRLFYIPDLEYRKIRRKKPIKNLTTNYFLWKRRKGWTNCPTQKSIQLNENGD